MGNPQTKWTELGRINISCFFKLFSYPNNPRVAKAKIAVSFYGNGPSVWKKRLMRI